MMVNPNEIRVIYLGSVSNEGSQGGAVYDSNGLAQTICACAHGYAMGYILVTVDERKDRKTDIGGWCRR